jgi:TolB-like protein
MANLFANSRDLRREFTTAVRTGNSLASIMQEQRFQRSGITDSNTISDLGKQMNVQYVVSGHTASLGSVNLLLISIVDVKTMRQIAGEYREYGRIEDVDGLIPSMAANIIAAIRGDNSSGDTLAVLPLIIEDSRVQQGDAEILAQIVATEIANGHKYAVFPRTREIETVMREHNIQSSSMTERDNVIEIGRAVNARYVLAGTVTRLGSKNMFLVQILDVVTGELIEGTNRQYADLAEGKDLMPEIVFEITGVEAGRFAEARTRERQAADAEQQRREAERKQQDADNFKAGLKEHFLGKNRLTTIGANLGMGFGNLGKEGPREVDDGYGGTYYQDYETGIDFNMFGNISITIPLVWMLFAEGGVDLGFLGSMFGVEDNSGGGGNYSYSATRFYGKVNISYPIGNDNQLFVPYVGIGYGSMKATAKSDDWRGTQSATAEYAGMDVAWGMFVVWGHFGVRFAVNMNTFTDADYAEFQVLFGAAYRF